MTTQTEALKLALEALETLVRLAEHEGWEGFDNQYNAITAIKEALAQPDNKGKIQTVDSSTERKAD